LLNNEIIKQLKERERVKATRDNKARGVEENAHYLDKLTA
jgi:hypothetical protein